MYAKYAKNNFETASIEKEETSGVLKDAIYGSFVTYVLGRSFFRDAKECVREYIPPNLQLKEPVISTFMKSKAEQFNPRLFNLYRNCPLSIKRVLTLGITLAGIYHHGEHLQHQWHNTKNHMLKLKYRTAEHCFITEESADNVAKMM